MTGSEQNHASHQPSLHEMRTKFELFEHRLKWCEETIGQTPEEGHEKRIRVQEHWRIYVLASCAAVSGMCTVTMALLGLAASFGFFRG